VFWCDSGEVAVPSGRRRLKCDQGEVKGGVRCLGGAVIMWRGKAMEGVSGSSFMAGEEGEMGGGGPSCRAVWRGEGGGWPRPVGDIDLAAVGAAGGGVSAWCGGMTRMVEADVQARPLCRVV
jgi:hypothetical protein